jgi:hypothetical protein
MKSLFNTTGGWKKLAMPAAALATAIGLAGCDNNAAHVASKNIKEAAENFEISRDVIFYNTITGQYFATLKGRCNIEIDTTKDKLDVTCKHGPEDIRNHYLGKAAGVTYFVIQTQAANVSEYQTRLTFNPQGFIPDIDFRGDASQLTNATRPDTHNKPVPREANPVTVAQPASASASAAALLMQQTAPKPRQEPK